MTGDVAAHIGERNTGLLTESRDERFVQIGHPYPGKSDEKEKIDQFAGLRVWEFCTLWTDLFPRSDSFADNAIYRLGEGGGCLVEPTLPSSMFISPNFVRQRASSQRPMRTAGYDRAR
jgi:hypothetical protein